MTVVVEWSGEKSVEKLWKGLLVLKNNKKLLPLTWPLKNIHQYI